MDEIELLRTVYRHAALPDGDAPDFEALRRKVWAKIDAQPETSAAPLFYLAVAGAIAASMVMFFTWDCQDLLHGSLFWLDPVTQRYHF